MNGNAELLNFIYQNAEMGEEGASKVLEVAKEEEFSKVLREQVSGYSGIRDEAARMMGERGMEPKHIGKMKKFTADVMIDMKTMTDTTTAHLAKMMVEGGTMGITDAIQKEKEYAQADEEVLKLMGKLRKFEEKSQETMKKFL